MTSNPDPTPFFLVGAIRSGTTVLRLILGHHPHICRCDEWEFILPALRAGPGAGAGEDYRRFLRVDRAFNLYDYRVDPQLDAVEQARSFIRQRLVADGKAIVGGNVHNGFAKLADMWPQARFIFVRRDPRDVARSCVQMGIAGSAWGATPVWMAAEQQWSQIQRRVDASMRMEVRFEDVIEDTNKVLGEICRFLGTEFDPAMLEIERDTTYTRPQTGVSHSWRMSAPRLEVRQIESRIGRSALEAAGYRHSGLPELVPAAPERVRLRLVSLYGRMLFRARRYGFWLWLADLLSRRMGWRHLSDKVIRQVAAIDNGHLI